MAAVPPRSRTLAEIKTKLLNPATTSHFQVNIGKPTDDDGTFNLFMSEAGGFLDRRQTTYRIQEGATNKG